MAAGGRSVQESDIVHDFPCSPCEKDGLNVAGVKYCVDCDENLCSTCLTHHRKFSMSRGHQVLDQVQMCKGHLKQLPTRRCSKHGGKIIDVYCPKHDTVGCSTCIALDHRSCEDIKFIPDVAAGITTSREFKQLGTDMETIESKLRSLKKQKRGEIKRLKQDKDLLIKDIRHVREQLSSQLDKMEKKLLDEAEAKFKQKIENINASISHVDSTLAQLEETMKFMNTDNQDSDIFISCKIGKQEIQECYPTVEELENLLPEQSLELHTEENARLIIEGKRMFAAITNKYCKLEAEYNNDKHVRLSDDGTKCIIYAICPLPDGFLAMSDFNNKKLMKLDPVSYNVSELVDLPDQPTGLCVVDDTRLAVSLINNKKIQFVSFDNPVTLGHNFTVRDKCRGLAHCDGLFYICCGGYSAPGHVDVYNCQGDLLKCLYEELQLPLFIAAINNGGESNIYISDFFKGVHVRGMDGVIKHRFPTVLNSDLPFCLIGSRHVCIGELSARKVYLHTRDGKRLLIDKDLKDKPAAMYFDEKSSQLFVTFVESSVIQVFDVKYGLV